MLEIILIVVLSSLDQTMVPLLQKWKFMAFKNALTRCLLRHFSCYLVILLMFHIQLLHFKYALLKLDSGYIQLLLFIRTVSQIKN